MNGSANRQPGRHEGTSSDVNAVLGLASRPVIFCAHPDDETIGACGVLMRSPRAVVVYLTDGAPRKANLRSPDVAGSRSKYAQTRLTEAAQALEIAGIGQDRVICLGSVDQEAIFEAVPRARYLAALLEHLSPECVITHSYEGGHPDHDSAALIARLSMRLLEQQHLHAPNLLEMTSYHALNGQLVTGGFLEDAGSVPAVIALSQSEADRKRQMMSAFRSQSRVLQSFPVGTEMLRHAPTYDFTLPPHAGKLWYECMGWDMTGERWRTLARSALSEMEAA